MHTKAKILLFTLLGAVLAFGSPLAYGQTDVPDNEFVTELLNASAGSAGVGAAAGFIMSLVAVLGKRIKSEAEKGGTVEPIILTKLLITVAIAGAVGWFAPMLGVTIEVTIPAVIGITYIVNQTLRPVFAKWSVK